MHKVFKTAEAAEKAADTAFVASAGGTVWGWLAHANEILQFIALSVAIVSGIFAIRYHAKKNDPK